MAKKKGNNYIIDEENGIAKIELNRWNGNENLWAIIDLDDLERVINFPYTWFAKFNKSIDGYYAAASQYIPELKRARPIHLHQFIMNATENNVDHINHNPLDDRKSNLRVITVSQNSRYRESKNSNNKSGYRNVSWDKKEQKWIVKLHINGKNKILGKFSLEDLDKAGQYAEEMRQKYYGEFAGFN